MLLTLLVLVVSAADPDLKWDVLDPNATERWNEYEEYINNPIYDSPFHGATLPNSVLNDFPKTSHADWNQKACGNCWVWSSTAVMTQSYKLFSGKSVPLSIQFFNSNFHNGNNSGTPPYDWACTGGGVDSYAEAYNEGLNQNYWGGPFVVPWSNHNASYGDALMTDADLKTLVKKDTINTTPNIGFLNITVLRVIGLTEPDQDKAINNLTSVIAEGKVIGFAIGWVDKNNLTYNGTRFQNDFNDTPWDTDPYDPSVQAGMTENGRTGHEMTIIGYNKTDTDKSKWYWIVQNSWGVTNTRPNGTIKFKMDMNYSATYTDKDSEGKVYQSPVMAFWTFNVTWKTDPTVTGMTPSTGENYRWVNITDLDGTGFVEGAVVNLTKIGQPDITSTGYVKVISSNKITTWFNLTDAAVGIWNLVVTNPDDRSGTGANIFTITIAPQTTNFTANQTRIKTAPAAVQFSDTSLNNPTSWSWNFGDGNTSTLQNPVNTYRKGKFNVSLTATNAYGSITKTETYYIYIGKFPIVSFNYAPTTIQINDTVSYDASGSTDPDGTITNYQWNFGDSNITSMAGPASSITHIFNQSQVYNVTLTITDNDAFTNSTMQQLQVIAKIKNSNTNINGSTITTSATGKQMIEVNLTNTNGTVTLPLANTVVINNPGNGWSQMKYVSNTNFVNESNGNINLSSISQVVMTTEPLITALNASTVGTVTSTVTLPLNQLPTGVTITQSITEGANVSVRDAFQLSATDNNLDVSAVAYTVQFQNTAIINANLTGAADPVKLNLSVLHSWVVANGPATDKIKIMRIADDGARSMLTTRYLGSSTDTLTDFFECDSPNGLSTFGVVAVSSTGGGGGGGSVVSGGDSDSGFAAPALTSPLTIAVNVGGNSAITKVTVTGTGVNNIIVTALPHSVLPGSIPPPATTVYQYIAVTPARYTTISSVTLNFNVPASWLADKGFARNDIALMLWDPATKIWSSLPTSLLTESQGTITYQAIAPHMSEFAIAYQKGAASQANVTVIQTSIPLSAPNTFMTPNLSIRPASPTQTQTIAPAASTPLYGVTPLTTMVVAVAVIIIIVVGSFLVRRWWIRRQNPALFRRYD